ncbi:MAG: CoA transferase, partial [Burkholderiales bacterium]|nr:CoA transferase [Burkholderiales bacterium]
QAIARLEAARIANAHVNTMHDVWTHPQLAARGRWQTVASPAGMLPALLPPGGDAFDARMDPIPALGEHTDSVLAELGFTAPQIAQWRAQGVV